MAEQDKFHEKSSYQYQIKMHLILLTFRFECHDI